MMTGRYSQEDYCLKSTLTSLQRDAGNLTETFVMGLVLSLVLEFGMHRRMWFSFRPCRSCGETILFLLEASSF